VLRPFRIPGIRIAGVGEPANAPRMSASIAKRAIAAAITAVGDPKTFFWGGAHQDWQDQTPQLQRNVWASDPFSLSQDNPIAPLWRAG